MPKPTRLDPRAAPPEVWAELEDELDTYAEELGDDIDAYLEEIGDEEEPQEGELSQSRRLDEGQALADRLADASIPVGADLLAGDVAALRRVVMDARPGPDGKIDAEALRRELMRAYRAMQPEQLSQVMSNVLLLAEMTGRYAVTKEALS